MDKDNAGSKENNNSQNKYRWINTILSIPEIGDLLIALIAVAPATIFSLIFIQISPLDDSSLPSAPVVVITVILIISMLVTTWWWLHYLERKIQLVIFLPIPFVKIPLRRVLYLFMLPLFGIRNIYRHFTTKDSTDS